MSCHFFIQELSNDYLKFIVIAIDHVYDKHLNGYELFSGSTSFEIFYSWHNSCHELGENISGKSCRQCSLPKNCMTSKEMHQDKESVVC